MNESFDVFGDSFFPAYFFDSSIHDDKEKSSSVESGKWEEIKNSQIYRDNCSDNNEKDDTISKRLGHKIDHSDRT